MNVTLEHLYPTLNRQHKETRKAYMGFLMWAVQDPEIRSIRLAARALRKSESLLRRWSGRWDWKDRMLGVDQPDIVVLCFLRNLIRGSEKETAEAIRASLTIAMPQSSLFQNLSIEDLQEKLSDGITLQPKVVQPPKAHVHVNVSAPEKPPESDPVESDTESRADEPGPTEERPAVIMAPGHGASVLPDAEEVEEDFRQMRKLVALGRAYILNQLREKRVRVTMTDILTLQKAAFLMYGGPTESIAFDFTGLSGMGAPEAAASVAESVAVRQARESGDKARYLAAIQEDLSEQQALIDVLMDEDTGAAK
jgi:hypothetical protein|tara:strand:- start:2507 stop:3433 length:927 start_codon:yes stop_codon:yes gene_type:complete